MPTETDYTQGCPCYNDSEDSDSDVSYRSAILANMPSAVERPRVERIMKRDMPMRQSWGHFSIKRYGVRGRLLFSDAFHLVLATSTWKLMLCCFSLYLVAWLVFATWWFHVAEPCGISIHTFKQALYLSVESMMTIGYGVDDPFFQNCSEVLPLLILQSFASLVLDIAILGILFTRFSRAYKRAATIIFSNALLLRERRGRVQLALRVAEMQEAPLLQVNLQAYGVVHRVDLTKERIDEGSDSDPDDIEEVVIKALHLQELDTNNNVLLCGLPMTVTHTIDRHSPMAPCNRYRYTAARDPSLKEVEHYFKELPYFEILIALSGVEEITGASVEGRMSYTLEEVMTGHEFGRCVDIDDYGRHCVDFNRFHDTFPLPTSRRAAA